jgi:hypothetical protein
MNADVLISMQFKMLFFRKMDTQLCIETVWNIDGSLFFKIVVLSYLRLSPSICGSFHFH